ncbi:hypothetical protein PPERSA_04920 [Pseudocohnilembus persalinus]|uniref:Uncharacterized protein n=1 Tax=Pseudocohnilembus persalinus TaxID=266149 RepID=A0A0V0R8E6_PSEPJ|nr:hypothetical protein PPERSA_04920 [Pseudocohnilembus persalinus]|eukprot:KRX10753.1 hypothetical protein PPERSA_04920 [Pseudocohnilembus persalinus]
MRQINKQLQDSICKYFYENNVTYLLKDELKADSIKDVTRIIFKKYDSPHQKQIYLKYLKFYANQFQDLNKMDEFNNYLYDIIYDTKTIFSVKEDDIWYKKWMTFIRKQMIALIILTFNQLNCYYEFKDLFAIWDVLFPETPLPRKKSPSESQTPSELSSYSEQQNDESQIDNQITRSISTDSITKKLQLSKSLLGSPQINTLDTGNRYQFGCEKSKM